MSNDSGFSSPDHFLCGTADEPLTLQAAQAALSGLENRVRESLHGLEDLIRKLILVIITGEHALIEGPPGVAKTRAAQTIASLLGLKFKRIQFAPDLMPSDIIHKERLELDADGKPSIRWLPGPIFTNVLVADEINRASPRAQAALLEVSEERQVTTLFQGRIVVRPQDPDPAELNEYELLGKSPAYFDVPLIDPATKRGQQFTMLATMNPIEQEGVYPLSEAQLDRFAFKLLISYPKLEILEEICSEAFESETGRIHSVSYSETDHVRCLYFLTGLREKLFGADAKTKWMDSDPADGSTWALSKLRSLICQLIAFTHPLQTANNTLTASGRALWDHLTNSRNMSATDAEQAIAQLPRVSAGSSPRGMLKLLRAVIAEAFMENTDPHWGHVRNVAPAVLRHRIRLDHSEIMIGSRPETLIDQLLIWLEPNTI